MTTEQPYVNIQVTGCGKCPHNVHAACSLEPTTPYIRWLEKNHGITPSCPLWEQRVEPNQPKEKA